MALPKRKTRARLRKERIIGPRCSHRQYRKRPDVSRRVQTRQPISMREMVYRLFNADKHNQEQKVNRVPKSYYRDTGISENNLESSCDSSLFRDSSPSIAESRCTKSAATSLDTMSKITECTNSSRASSTDLTSVSNITMERSGLKKSIDNTRALLKKKSLVRIINNYIKAGIEEGKRQAKKYIRKALSFGVRSGYLIPTDLQGQVIRVSPTLIESRRRDMESRKRRRRARKGEDDPLSSDKFRRRTPTPPWNAKNIKRREDTPRPETPPRKRKKITDVKNLKPTPKKKNPRKKPTVARVEKDKKKNNRRKKNKLVVVNLTDDSIDGSQDEASRPKKKRNSRKGKAVEKKQSRRRRKSRSPSAKKEQGSNNSRQESSEKEEGSGKFYENETEEIAPIGRRKSRTSREASPQTSSGMLRNSSLLIDENLDPSSQENNENNETENLN